MNKEEFINELKKINIELTKQQLTLLEEYYIILKEENEKYNLTRIIEQNEVYLKHFYDSLTINKIIDIYSQNICRKIRIYSVSHKRLCLNSVLRRVFRLIHC